MRLLGEDEFRRQVLMRDSEICVLCGAPAAEAHYIMDRRLWDDGGTYLDNGAALCSTHFQTAQATTTSVAEIREHAKIAELCLPPQLHAVQSHDKWGNPLLAEGRRARGELFFDPDVQAWLELGGKLPDFTPWVKYPRTFVLPWSDFIGVGDRRMASVSRIGSGRVIASEKMDGENVTLYRDFLHTRSIARIAHPSRQWLNDFWEQIRSEIPSEWRICGEYLYVAHSVKYDRLTSYFQGFSVWNDKNICLPWDETQMFFDDLGVTSVPTFYDGVFDPPVMHEAWKRTSLPGSEGYIVRSAAAISYADFRHLVGKYVRAGYVQSEPVRNNVLHGEAITVNGTK